MPFEHRTPFGTTSGNLTPAEEMQQRVAAQSDALRAQLAIAQMGNDTQRHGIDSQQAIAGTYGQRAGQDTAMFDKKAQLDRELDQAQTQRSFGTVDRQMAPSLLDAKLRGLQYQDSAGVDNARRSMQIQALKQASGMLGGMGSPAQAGAPAGGGNDKWDQLAALGALANGGQMPDFGSRDVQRQTLQMGLEDQKRKRLEDQIGDFSQHGQYDQASALARANKMPFGVPGDKAMAMPEVAGVVQKAVSLMGSIKGTDSFSNLDDSAEYQNLTTLIDEASNLMASKYNVDPAQARALVMQKIKEALPEDTTGGWFTGEGTLIKDWGQQARRLMGESQRRR